MRVAIIIAVAIALGAGGVVPSTGVAYGQAKRGQPTYGVYFPNISIPPDAGISLVRIVVTCGHVAAVTRIPDDWYVGTLRPDTESEPEWNEFRSTWNAVEFEAGHGVTRLRNLKSLDGAIKVTVEDPRCFDMVADIKDDMTDDGWKTRLRTAVAIAKVIGKNGSLFTNSLSPLRGWPNPTNQYPRLARPRLGLNSDRCYAACESRQNGLLLSPG